MENVRQDIVDYLFHVASVEVGSIFGPREREVVEFCAHWVQNELDQEWKQKRAAQLAREAAATSEG